MSEVRRTCTVRWKNTKPFARLTRERVAELMNIVWTLGLKILNPRRSLRRANDFATASDSHRVESYSLLMQSIREIPLWDLFSTVYSAIKLFYEILRGWFVPSLRASLCMLQPFFMAVDCGLSTTILKMLCILIGLS